MIRTGRTGLISAVLVLPVSAVLVSAGAATATTRPHAGPMTPVLRVNRPAPASIRPVAVPTAPLLVPDPAVYAAQKAAANAASSQPGELRSRSASASAPAAPAATVVRNWPGQQDTQVAPSDSTGAIGTASYIELVNDRAAVYSRTSDTPIASGTLLQLTGCATTGCKESAFDPQLIWDPGTGRFFYAAADVVSASENLLDIGFSTTATPTLSASSWCRYSLNFGSTFPDYPKLGDTRNFMLVGSNNFSGTTYTGSTITWLAMPPPGPSCPAPSALKRGVSAKLKNANGSLAFTPVPANQADASPTGWAVARPAAIPSGGATFLTLFKVTRSAAGTAMIPATGTSVPVNRYKVPASAPEMGAGYLLDTLDARPTQAVLAVDPSHGVTALWTQHTVFGGAGSQVRWYEINPAARTLVQHGTVTSASLFTFDGAISPDRLNNGTTSKFGSDMVIDVVQSSATILPTIKVASKVGSAPLSALRVIATSAAPDAGFDCIDSPAHLCRWGDYAAATPDPAAPVTGTVGEVWGSSMLAAPGGNASTSGWTTQNFAIEP